MGTSFVWTAAEAVQALRNTLGDPSGATVTRWTAAEMDDYWNRAAYQLTLDAEVMLESTWTFLLVEDQREYKLDGDLFKIKKVQFLNGSTDTRQLDYLTNDVYWDLNVTDETDTASIPTHYYLWRLLGDDPTSAQQPGSIYIHPTPDATAAASMSGSDNMRIWGYKFPDLIDSGGAGTKTVEVPPVYVEAVIMYAASLAMADDGEVTRSRDFLDRYESQVRKVREALAVKDRSNTSQIRPKGAKRRSGDPWDAFPRWGR